MRVSGRSLALAVVLALCVTIGLTACAGRDSGSAGKPVRIAFVPKVTGIPYFDAMNTGGQEAAAQLGAQWVYQGPATTDPAAQITVVRSLIQQHVDVLAVAPNDPASMAPVLNDARAAGIHVMTSDTDAPDSAREVFVNQATADGIGRALTDALMAKMGGAGDYAIVSCGPTAVNLNSWIAVQRSYTARAYPKARIVDVVYAGEDQAKATQLAKDLMTRYPNLTGLVGECTTSAPGVAAAVRDTDRIGKVYTVGVGTPQAIKPYLEDGSSTESVLWNVEQLGYLTAWAGEQLADDKPLTAVNKVSAELPAVRYDRESETLLLGDPLLLTTANVDQFKY
jgi:rhamnose transport system substrate-binding protein